MEQTSSNSSSFEDLAKDNDLKDEEKLQDEVFMDILGNNQLTKKVSVCVFSNFTH